MRNTFDNSTLDRIVVALNSYLQSRPVHPLPRNSRVQYACVSTITKTNSASVSSVLKTGQSVSFATSLVVQFSPNQQSPHDPDQKLSDGVLPVYVKRTPPIEDTNRNANANGKRNGKRLRVVQSAMNELVFYMHVLPDLLSKQAIHAPALFSAVANTPAHRLHLANTSDGISSKQDIDDVFYSETSLVLESFATDSFYQCSPLKGAEVVKVLRSLARLHSTTMGDTELLTIAQQKLQSPAYWRLSRRPATEVEELPLLWKEFVAAFKGVNSRLDDFFRREQAMEMGERLCKIASTLDSDLDRAALNQALACIVHGDPKAMNMFMPHGPDSGNVVFIDFQWTGVGIGALDIAMFLPHSVHPSEIDSAEKVDALLLTYYNAVEENNKSVKETYSFAQFKYHFEIASLDYARFVIARFFKGATPGTMEKKKNDPNIGLMYRNVTACAVFLERIYDYLRDYLK